MTLVSQYRIIYDKVFNSAKENPKSLAQNAIKIKYFYGEAKTMLNFAITSLYDARGAGISESKSKLNVVVAQIGNYAKASYYLGKEFKKEVTNLSNIMYKNIISNTGPYRETSYWTSDYGDVKCHLHKDSEAYKFFSSKVYKDSIAFGKVTNVVMPLVSSIMTSYVIYKKYITSTPNNFNGKNNTIKNEFKSDKLLDQHYEKHVIKRGEFGDITKDQYLKQAQGLVQSSGNGVLTKIRTNGDKIFYRISTNEFAVIDSSGNIKTYFKPSGGIDYFNKQ